jgi:RNA polymerase sigma-70 factor (ECF subfamily)
MAGPVFRRVDGATATTRVVPLDRDRALVEAAQADPRRFEVLYRKYVAQVYSYAVYELRDHHAAEDATERTFMNALAALPGFREGAVAADGPDASTFRVWLFRIARNVVANEHRSRRRHPGAPLDAAAGVADGLDPAAHVGLREEAAAAWAAVARLPDDRRRALVLRFVEEMSIAEIAAILERSEGAVRVLIHRALRAVAADLAGDAAADLAGDAAADPHEPEGRA